MGREWLGPFNSLQEFYDQYHGGVGPFQQFREMQDSMFVGIPTGRGNARHTDRGYNSGNRFGPGGSGLGGGGLGSGYGGGGGLGGNMYGGMGGGYGRR